MDGWMDGEPSEERACNVMMGADNWQQRSLFLCVGGLQESEQLLTCPVYSAAVTGAGHARGTARHNKPSTQGGSIGRDYR